jgi:RimJ/RimL family protein N-acetyltransferase
MASEPRERVGSSERGELGEHGSGVSIRAVGEDDIDRMLAWRNDPEFESSYGDFLQMHRRSVPLRERWLGDGLLGEDTGHLVICLDGAPVGVLQWHTVGYGPNTGSRALNFGISVDPAVRGRGVGSRAQRLLADYLFAHTVVHRVEASTDVTNVAEQRALEKAGFRREGILRGAQFRLGEWHDLVSYSRLRTDD